jgi:hypothetical protein
MAQVRSFESHLTDTGKDIPVRPWHFEVDPFRRHSVIAAVGIRFNAKRTGEVIAALRDFASQTH